MCTYENWPKSTKCAMCGSFNTSQRSQASSLIITSPDRNIENDINQDDRYKDYILGKNVHKNFTLSYTYKCSRLLKQEYVAEYNSSKFTSAISLENNTILSEI